VSGIQKIPVGIKTGVTSTKLCWARFGSLVEDGMIV
jgi:hypothetical protein